MIYARRLIREVEEARGIRRFGDRRRDDATEIASGCGLCHLPIDAVPVVIDGVGLRRLHDPCRATMVSMGYTFREERRAGERRRDW